MTSAPASNHVGTRQSADVRDRRSGAAARDWFFANLIGSGAHDKITDLKNGELAEELIL